MVVCVGFSPKWWDELIDCEEHMVGFVIVLSSSHKRLASLDIIIFLLSRLAEPCAQQKPEYCTLKCYMRPIYSMKDWHHITILTRIDRKRRRTGGNRSETISAGASDLNGNLEILVYGAVIMVWMFIRQWSACVLPAGFLGQRRRPFLFLLPSSLGN